MILEQRYKRHKDAIQKRWEPISIEVLLHEEPEMKIRILKKAEQVAAKDIQDQEEQLSFLEYLDGQLKCHEGGLKQNDFSRASQTAKSNEPLNTGGSNQESENGWKQIEKINWRGHRNIASFIDRFAHSRSFP
jgi:hypothetical protein